MSCAGRPGGSARDPVDRLVADRWGPGAAPTPPLERRSRLCPGPGPLRAVAADRIAEQVGRTRALWHRPGPTVAFLAPDGAGKSTLIESLRTSMPVPVTVGYLGLYPSGAATSSVRGLGTVLVLGRIWRRWLHCAAASARGGVVLFDRYVYDALIPSGRAPLRTRLRRGLLARSLPAPTLTIVLDVPADVLHARKGEKDVARLDAERAAYAALARRLPRAVVVDASGTRDEVQCKVTALIWELLAPTQRAPFTS